MAGDVLETDSMQQTEDETRKADWASRVQGWTVVATQTRRRRATRYTKGMRVETASDHGGAGERAHPSPRAHHHLDRTGPTPRRQSLHRHRHRHRHRAVLVARLSRWQRV
jgi:hypothetical protein